MKQKYALLGINILISQKVFDVNDLKQSSSLYLLQHANNPVHWKNYSDDIWELARIEDKLVLLSIGYSSCHWCHVMEHHVFEDEQCAQLMNQHLINVKIDKEERPDLDMIYMDAAHVMNKPGGWPLNVFCLPNGKPIHVETYVPKANWISLIQKLTELHEERREDVMAYGHQIFQVVEQIQNSQAEQSASLDDLAKTYMSRADLEFGGFKGAPKFPMPGLLSTMVHLNRSNSREHVAFTAQRILQSGLYDHVEGGIFRYTVDDKWGVPHFEKMLYDNAQFLSLLCELIELGYSEFQIHAQKTLIFLLRQFKNSSHLFGSSFDADCEGKEGAYYTLTKEEVDVLNDAAFDTSYWHWMENDYVPALNNSLQVLPPETIEKLIALRKHKPKPNKDEKTIAAWNGMALVACLSYLENDPLSPYKEEIERTISRVCAHFIKGTTVYRISEEHGVEGFLEDYAWMLKALIEVYRKTLNEEYLNKAISLANTIELKFESIHGQLVFSTTKARNVPSKIDQIDNVTPSSNAVLFECFTLLNAVSEKQWNKIESSALAFPFEQWKWVSNALLSAELCSVKCVGKNAKSTCMDLLLNSKRIDIACLTESTDSITIYVCKNQTCFAPVHSIQEALELIQ